MLQIMNAVLAAKDGTDDDEEIEAGSDERAVGIITLK